MPITHPILGDHLVAKHPESTGHGILVGNDQVIHWQTVDGCHQASQLALTSLEAFCQGHPVQKKEHAHRQFSREDSVARAYASLGEHQSFANGEQFVSWCIDGPQSSSKLVPTVVASVNPTVVTSVVVPTVVASVVATEVARHTLGKAATTTAAGIAAATLTAATTGSTATTAVMASAAGVVSAPVLAPLAVCVVTAYGAAKLWDWLTD